MRGNPRQQMKSPMTKCCTRLAGARVTLHDLGTGGQTDVSRITNTSIVGITRAAWRKPPVHLAVSASPTLPWSNVYAGEHERPHQRVR